MIRSVIFDFGSTIYDVEEEQLLDDALETLETLHKKGLKLALVSRAADPQKRLLKIEELGLNKFFDFIESIPSGTIKEFDSIIKKFGFKPEEFLVVGDRFTHEIAQGNLLGMETVRILNGPEKDMESTKAEEMPDHTIIHLKEVLNLV